MQKKGVLFVFSGPSGVGKGTLKAKLFEEFAGKIAYSVSQPRADRVKAKWMGKTTFLLPGRSLKAVCRIMNFWSMRCLRATAMERRAHTLKSC